MKRILLSSFSVLLLQLSIYGQSELTVSDFKVINDSLVRVTNDLGQSVIINLKKLIVPNNSNSTQNTSSSTQNINSTPSLIALARTDNSSNIKEQIPVELIYDSLSSALKPCGNMVIWDLQNVDLSKYAPLENDLDRAPIIKPEILIKNYPVFSLNDSLVDTIQIQYLNHYLKVGQFTAKYEAQGRLKLPNGKTYENARKIKVIEQFKLTDVNDGRFCFTNENTYFYFFDNNNDTCPIFRYSEKLKDNCNPSFKEYYKEISLPQPRSMLTNTVGLDSIINLKLSPNPAHGEAIVSYYLPDNGNVLLSMGNLINNVSFILENSGKTAGQQEKAIILTGLIPGKYYVQLEYKGFVFQKQLLVN